MSNPVTNAEVEDVLSSIRRLVSSDTRPVGRGSQEGTKPNNEAAQPGADRLVLTPALRVAVVREVTPPNDVDQIDVDHDDGATSTVRAQEDAEIAAQTTPHWDASLVDDGMESDVSDRQGEAADEVIEADQAEPAAYGSRSEIDPEELRFLFRARKRLTLTPETAEDETATSEGETATAEANEEAELDESTIETVESIEVQKPSTLLLTDPEPYSAEIDDSEAANDKDERAALEEDTEPANEPASNTPTDAGPPQELTAKIAALEAVIAQTPDQWEPDGDSVDEYAGTSVGSLAWEDHIDLDGSGAPFTRDQVGRVTPSAQETYEAEAQVIEPEEAIDEDPTLLDGEDEAGEPAATEDVADEDVTVVDLAGDITADPQGDSDDSSREASFAIDDAVLDEDALRELVSDIVRQELEGSLGERITHNVRKLVRRELQRAMAAKELE